MRDGVPSARYSPVCNVLRQWKTSLIPTYRVYRLYDIITIIAELHSPYLLCICIYIIIVVSEP